MADFIDLLNLKDKNLVKSLKKEKSKIKKSELTDEQIIEKTSERIKQNIKFYEENLKKKLENNSNTQTITNDDINSISVC